MRYLSLDLETTGLDPMEHQVLQIGAVLFEFLDTGILILGEFQQTIMHAQIVGQRIALAMNADLLREGGLPQEVVQDKFDEFLRAESSVTVVGKNVAGFDIPFLKHSFGYCPLCFSHRTLDVGSLLFTPEEGVLNLSKCKEKVGLKDTTVQHTALADARDVVDILSMHFYGGPVHWSNANA